MSSTLTKRKPTKTTEEEEGNEEESNPFVMSMPSQSKLSCYELQQLGPEKCGFCEKKSNSYLPYILPCFYPKWKRRFLVLVGNYLYRFESEDGERPKGIPIPIDSVVVKVLEEEGSVFELSTIRKSYLFRVESLALAREWANAITQRKFQSIKENMGHAPVKSEVKRVNQLGFKLFDQKMRAERGNGEVNMNYNPMLGPAMM